MSRRPSPHPRARKRAVTFDDPTVRAEDLSRLRVVHDIIGTLDDPRASARQMAEAVEAFPALAARIQRRFTRCFPLRELPSLSEQIAVLGIRELEIVLFALLEDLTVLRADLEEAS